MKHLLLLSVSVVSLALLIGPKSFGQSSSGAGNELGTNETGAGDFPSLPSEVFYPHPNGESWNHGISELTIKGPLNLDELKAEDPTLEGLKTEIYFLAYGSTYLQDEVPLIPGGIYEFSYTLIDPWESSYSGESIAILHFLGGEPVEDDQGLVVETLARLPDNPDPGLHRVGARVRLLKVDLEWEAQDEENNPISENPNVGGGKRYYPGKVLPTESGPRNLVTVKVNAPGLPGKAVKLKSFDVDDPAVDILPFFRADEIDPNQDAGDDNFEDYLNTPKSGQFVLGSGSSTTATVILDENGFAEIDFQVGMQPGNNYRVIAVLEDHLGNFDQLQVSESTADAFVPPGDHPVSGFTGAGVASPMLTVWRKLHIEQDSMGAIPTSGSEKNFEEGTIAGASPVEINPGVWGTEVDLGTIYTGDYVTDEFNKGRLEVFGNPVFDSNGMPVHEVTAFDPGFPATLPGDVNDNASVTVMGTLGASAIGKTSKLYDDDERGLPGSHQPLLPRFDLIADAVSQKYASAYITVIDADSLGLNPNMTVNFEKHNELNNLLPNVANNAEDLSSYADDEDFWTLLVTAVYQGSTSEDHDPDTETPPLEGALLENLLGASPAFAVIFMEGIREDAWTALNSRNLASVQAGQQSFVNRIADVVAHEIGHAPAGSATGDEHDEGGLMGSGIQGADFRAESVARFRKAQTWR